MARAIFLFILFVHGLIHLMGFVKAFKLADIPQLTQPISKTNGLLWLLTTLLFVAAAALLFMKKDVWWMIALPAVVLSQILIALSWGDAKFGTIANLIALAGITLGWAAWDFNKMVAQELDVLLPKTQATPEMITEERIQSLPPIVQTWLRRSNALGKPRIQTVHLHQKGEMRTTPEGKWTPVEAEQYFTTDPPGFIWVADVEMMSFLHLAGRDKYKDGKGHMLIKALSLLPVADATGAETDQGTMLRYLAEIIWFPTAALSDYITWEQVDATSAKATMTYGDVTASGVFTFNQAGDMLYFEADRYYDRKEGATLERWHIENADYKEMNGIRIPVKSAVSWKLKEGDFTWYQLEITKIEYNFNR